jgi:hypothetical protein
MVHKELAAGKWFLLSLVEQLANVGMEIERTISWRQQGNHEYSTQSFERALELLYLTIKDNKNKGRRKELVRARELLADHFYFNNEYQSSEQSWQEYFYLFNYAAALVRRQRRLAA